METSVRNGIVLIRPAGDELGAEVADAFKAEATASIPPNAARIAVDLSHIRFMDSSGLSALVAVLKHARRIGEMVVFGVRPPVLEILRLTRLDAVFTLCEKEEDAIAYFAASLGEEDLQQCG